MLIAEKQPELDLFYWPEGSKEQTDLETSHAVLDDLFSWYALDDLKACLWVWLKTALESDTQYAESRAKNLIFLYEHICDLVAAAYVIARESKKLIENAK